MDADVILAALANDLVDLSSLGVGGTPRAVKARRRTLEAGFGQTSVPVDAAYTLPAVAGAVAQDPDLLEALGVLEAELGLPFLDRFAGRFGNLDLFHLQDPSGVPAPIAISSDRSQPGRERFVIRRRSPLLEQDLVARLVLTSGEDVLDDRLIGLPSGVEGVAVPAPVHVAAYDLSVYPAQGGERVFAESSSYLMETVLNSRIGHEDLEIDDRLTSRLESRPDLLKAAGSRRTYTSSIDTISDPEDRIRAPTRRIIERVRRARSGSQDRWFARTLDNEVGVISHLDGLLDASRLTRAILVDPFFGRDSLSRLLLRLGSRDLDLTIVTSWGETDPDTAEKADADDNIRDLGRALDRVKALLAPKVKVRNLVRAAGGQAFHDRYLLLQGRDETSTIYLLSNSVNAMAARWPFVMSALSGEAANQAENYVEALARGEGIPDGAALATTFQWPPQ